MQPGDILFLPIWALHRHELLWDAPEQFRPDRFEADAATKLYKYQFLPFGAEPRVSAWAPTSP